MTTSTLADLNILSQQLLPTPQQIKHQLPLVEKAREAIVTSRQGICDILDRKDPRILLVLGPCSIHDSVGAIDYARRLKTLADQVADVFLIVMRVYFCKPRTSVGWKGLINDPHLDDSFKIDEGLYLARKLLIEIASLGLGTGTEALDSLTPQYLDDLISWHAIGARTTESQTHRELASGLSTPVGFKNGTDGNLLVAVNALKSAASSHNFLGINHAGLPVVFRTAGNRYGHIVLRGGNQPNYDSVNVALCEMELSKAGLPVTIMIDCSHGNSLKNHELQPLVFDNCIQQICDGNKSIIGMMIESNIEGGNQPLTANKEELKYGMSITDACIDWKKTEEIVKSAALKLRQHASTLHA
jgi:3-deoxy-7-phosphoheptulonate synthase